MTQRQPSDRGSTQGEAFCGYEPGLTDRILLVVGGLSVEQIGTITDSPVDEVRRVLEGGTPSVAMLVALCE